MVSATAAFTCPRPVCHGVGTVLEVRRCSNGSTRRRLERCDCGHRWTAHQGQPPGHRGGLQRGQRLRFTRLTEAEVRAILQASGSAKSIAAQVGRSHPTVLAVLSGKWHADGGNASQAAAPWWPGFTGRSPTMFGDTTDSGAQLRALGSLGLQASTRRRAVGSNPLQKRRS